MLAACAAKADRQIALALAHVVGNQINQKSGDAVDELLRLRKRADIFGDTWMASGKAAELGNEMRIGQETHVEQQVGVVGNSGLVPKADHRNQNVLVGLARTEFCGDVSAQLVNRET